MINGQIESFRRRARNGWTPEKSLDACVGSDVASDIAGAPMPMNIDSSAWLEGRLQARLEEVFAGVKERDVVVAYGSAGSSSIALLGSRDGSARADAVYLQTGCLTKLLTAFLLERAIAQGKLAADCDVSECFPRRLNPEMLRGISIRHLLDHTHGLDDSSRKRLSRRMGFIDLKALVSDYERRLSCPGEIYSYSNVGARLIAAMLEHVYRAAYSDILLKEAFAPLDIEPRINGINASGAGEDDVCPARGGVLALRVQDLARFLESAVARDRFWPGADNGTDVTPLPGWSPFERGVYRGWKCYGDGWYGHSAVTEDKRTSLVRVHPERRIVIVLASAKHHANMVAAKLFGKELPGFRSLKIPKPLHGEALENVDARAYCGNYSNAAERFSIVSFERGSITLIGSHYEVDLAVAEHNILLPRQAAHSSMGFVQLVWPDTGIFRYLWDGQRLYRNEEDRANVNRVK